MVVHTTKWDSQIEVVKDHPNFVYPHLDHHNRSHDNK